MKSNKKDVVSGQYGGNVVNTLSRPKPNIVFIVGLIVGAIVLIAVLLVLWINVWRAPSSIKENTPTLQLYAVLNDGILMDNLDEEAKGIDEDFEVMTDYQEDFGTIRLPNAEDYIIFTFYREIVDNNNGNEDDGSIIVPYAAYDITYVLGGETDDVLSYNAFEQLYEYYDGIDTFQFETKKEAIEGFLAS